MRQHWCRRHIKTFGEEKPFMGKYVGSWVWGPQLRGNKKKGFVVKDYNVKRKK